MDLFNQPNVKGWDGGNSWITSQIFYKEIMFQIYYVMGRI